MNLIQKLLIAGSMTTIAGCSSSPDWTEPKVRDQPLVLEEAVETPEEKPEPAVKKPANKETKTLYTIALSYEFESKLNKGLFNGVCELEKADTPYKQALLASKVSKDLKVSSQEISDYIVSNKYSEVPLKADNSAKLDYTQALAGTADQEERVKKMLEGKDAFYQLRFAKLASEYKSLDKEAVDEIEKKIKF